MLASVVEANGGRLVEFGLLHGDDEWDAMMICQYPERPPAAGLVAGDFMARGGGTIAAERIVELVDPDEVDALVSGLGQTAWKPAGS